MPRLRYRPNSLPQYPFLSFLYQSSVFLQCGRREIVASSLVINHSLNRVLRGGCSMASDISTRTEAALSVALACLSRCHLILIGIRCIIGPIVRLSCLDLHYFSLTLITLGREFSTLPVVRTATSLLLRRMRPWPTSSIAFRSSALDGNLLSTERSSEYLSGTRCK